MLRCRLSLYVAGRGGGLLLIDLSVLVATMRLLTLIAPRLNRWLEWYELGISRRAATCLKLSVPDRSTSVAVVLLVTQRFRRTSSYSLFDRHLEIGLTRDVRHLRQACVHRLPNEL